MHTLWCTLRTDGPPGTDAGSRVACIMSDNLRDRFFVRRELCAIKIVLKKTDSSMKLGDS